MPLYVIATPIGNPEDISFRAQKLLKSADIIIGEEAKPTRRLLKSVDVSPQKDIRLLNEHSSPQDVEELKVLCQNQTVALISDCGTPGFCDPGALLVQALRKAKIEITSVPGPSSLMALLSVCGHRLDQFYFQGFLPAKTELRQKQIKALAKRNEPIILMDTPYRLKKTLEECKEHFPKKNLVLGLKMSMPEEAVLEGKAKDLLQKLPMDKAEFVLIIL